jgi:hypothetical protein
MTLTLWRASMIVVASLIGTRALAAEAASPATAASSTSVVASGTSGGKAPGKRLHRGFFLRLSFGMVDLHETSSFSGGSPGATYSGLGNALEASIGHSVLRPGLIVGGKWVLAAVVDPTESYQGGTYTMSTSAHFVDVLAAFVDDYPDPRRGFHFGGSVGLLAVTDLDAVYGTNSTGWGPALSAHVGWESYFSSRWSCGLLGQLTVYRYGETVARVSSTTNGVLPTVALAFTFN